jgi:hypothetical protein
MRWPSELSPMATVFRVMGASGALGFHRVTARMLGLSSDLQTRDMP